MDNLLSLTALTIFDLQQVPNRRTINHFTNNILTEEIKEIIDFIVKKIEETSGKFSFLIDLNIIEPEKPKKKFSERAYFYKKNQKTREVSRMFKRRFSSVLNLNIGCNAKYTKNDFIDLLLHMMERSNYAEGGAKSLKIKKDKVPNGETLLYHLKKYKDVNQIRKIFTNMAEMNWELARRANHFRRKVDMGIDYTEIPFFGNKNTNMIVEKKPEKGTSYCYKYATINIVEPNNRFILQALPSGKFDTKEQILKNLLEYSSKRVKINRVYLDRAFFSSSCISIFNQRHVKFITPCTQNSRIKKLLEIMPAPTVIKDYQMGLTRFNVVIVKDEHGIKRAFATNIDFNENEPNLSERLFLLYSRRWSVETSYRMLKHSFWMKTTSKNYFIRLFYFLLSTFLYNTWLLSDILICFAVFGYMQETYIVTSKHFIAILFDVDPRG